MRRALICGKWELPVLEGKSEQKVAGGARSYYDFINGRTDEIGRNVQCLEHLVNQLQGIKINRVVEPFGGIGGFTTVIQNLLHPLGHVIWEMNEDCERQLVNAFDANKGIHIYNEDSREVFGTYPADLYVLDIPSPSTLKSYPKWEIQWTQVWGNQPKAVIWHDSASRYLHLHLDTYSKVVGMPITDHESYGVAMQHFMRQRHDAFVTHMAYSQSAHYFLARSDEGGPPRPQLSNFHKITSGAAGFQWL